MSEYRDVPEIPPDGEVNTDHIIERVPHGWDVVVEVRQLRPDMSDTEVLGFALLHVASALSDFGIDPIGTLRAERDRPSHRDDDDDSAVPE